MSELSHHYFRYVGTMGRDHVFKDLTTSTPNSEDFPIVENLSLCQPTPSLKLGGYYQLTINHDERVTNVEALSQDLSCKNTRRDITVAKNGEYGFFGSGVQPWFVGLKDGYLHTVPEGTIFVVNIGTHKDADKDGKISLSEEERAQCQDTVTILNSRFKRVVGIPSVGQDEPTQLRTVDDVRKILAGGSTRPYLVFAKHELFGHNRAHLMVPLDPDAKGELQFIV